MENEYFGYGIYTVLLSNDQSIGFAVYTLQDLSQDTQP